MMPLVAVVPLLLSAARAESAAALLAKSQALGAQGEYGRSAELLRQGLASVQEPAAKIALLLQLAADQQQLQLGPQRLGSLQQALAQADKAALAEQKAEVQMLLAEYYAEIGQYAQALAAGELAEKAWRQIKAAKGGAGNRLARVLLQRARIYVAMGRHTEAIESGYASLSAMDHANDKSFFGEQLLVMGEAHFLRGGFETKRVYIEMALQQAEQGQLKTGQIKALAEMSRLYNSWGQPEQALLHLQSALELARSVDPVKAQALMLERGEIQLALGQPEAARADFEQARALLVQDANRYSRAHSLLRLGQGYAALDDGVRARQDLTAAQAGFEALALPYQAAQAVFGLAELARARGAHAEALPLYQAAIARVAGLDDQVHRVYYYGGLGQSQLALGQIEPAILSLEIAIQHGRSLYGLVGEASQREFFEKLVPIHLALIRAYYQAGRLKDALRQIEESRSLSFWEMISQGDSARIQKFGLDEWKPWSYGLEPGNTILIYAGTDAEQMLQFRVRYNSERKQYTWQEDYQEGVAVASERLLSQHPLLLRHAAALGLDGSGPLLPRLCRVYRQLLSNPQADAETIADLGALLYQVLIGPHEAQLASMHTLTIVPEGELGLIPFETLRDAQGRYLIERFDIRYIHSVSILKEIEGRNHPATRAPMLVVGDPVYEPQTYERTPIASAQQLLELKKLIWKYPEASMREAYAALYSPQWEPLPGTRAEVEGIEQAIPGSRALTGAAAEEAGIKTLAESGELARYKVLHFATHGLAVPEIPELSALVLSQFSSPGSEDGYLRMPEIARLPLRADFVNLSACETGLGKVFRGEGVVGLTQAFLSAGANQVAVSLWQIDDQASARFMQTLYDLPGANHGQNLNRVKQRFLKGEFGAAYKHPYYWSPFVVYGRL